jgi:transposase
MSINNSILKLLNMKDKNLNFNENFVVEREIKNKRCLVILGYLKNDFEYCPCCGCINENTIIKKGTRNSLIKINKHAELTTYLDLTKQRYKCKNCNKKFYATTLEVDYRCHISNQVKLAILNCAKEMMCKSLIARLYNVSDNTVQSIFDTVFYNDTVYKDFLPKAICIDEFTFKKKTYAFNICNAKNGKTIDLVLDRTTNNLDKYFSHYTEKARKRVKFVVMDMYSPYIDLIKKWFPNAKIIIDLFHIVQLLTKSLNKTRINVMNENKDDRNKFKRYWRFILKSRFDLDSSTWNKFRCFKNLMTEIDVVNYLLSKDKFFENSYDLYQDILYHLQHRNYEGFNKVVNKEYKDISKQIQITLNTLKKYSKYIKNTLEYSYSNGVMERNNNTCKLIKRISFGFKNFRNMKSRIMIITNIFRKDKREYHTKYSTPKYA